MKKIILVIFGFVVINMLPYVVIFSVNYYNNKKLEPVITSKEQMFILGEFETDNLKMKVEDAQGNGQNNVIYDNLNDRYYHITLTINDNNKDINILFHSVSKTYTENGSLRYKALITFNKDYDLYIEPKRVNVDDNIPVYKVTFIERDFNKKVYIFN